MKIRDAGEAPPETVPEQTPTHHANQNPNSTTPDSAKHKPTKLNPKPEKRRPPKLPVVSRRRGWGRNNSKTADQSTHADNHTRSGRRSAGLTAAVVARIKNPSL